MFFLITVLYDEDDPYDVLEWIAVFMVVVIYITAPLMMAYIYSVVRAIRMRTRTDVTFLVFHCLNLLQLICAIAVSNVSHKDFTPEAMEADYRQHQVEIMQLIAHTRDWLSDSTYFSIDCSRHGKITAWSVEGNGSVRAYSDGYSSEAGKDKGLRKVGLSMERLDSLGTALQEMGYRGISIGKQGAGDYTEITYGTNGNTVLYYHIYDKPLADSLIRKFDRSPAIVVYNRHVVFYCQSGTLAPDHFPGKEEYLKKHAY
ncbi:MAG: hypothetical protein K6A82_06765 [Prevotella sp.]|nr:hypothetical protein [Prevotella sp.]